MGYTIRNAGYIGKSWVTGTVAKSGGGVVNTDLARFMPRPLFAYTTNKFTPCGATGINGPTESDCDTEYAGEVWLDDYFSVSGGIQKFTIPMTGSYTFSLRGAGGGDGPVHNGGYPRQLIGTLNLNVGDVIEMAIGQLGEDWNGTATCGGYDRGSGGGGGGTFVYNETTSTLLFAAGGGGGSSRTLEGERNDAPSSTEAQNGTGQSEGAPGGEAGEGGDSAQDDEYACTHGGGGGGGYEQDGEVFYPAHQHGTLPGEGFLQGGQGGASPQGDGGFGGGGGAGFYGAGGGGGYSGGGGGGMYPHNCSCNNGPAAGGAGGSFVIASATSETNTLAYSVIDGYCWITYNA